MKNPSNSSEQALEDYFKDLLCEPTARKSAEAIPLRMATEEVISARPSASLTHLSTRITSNSAVPLSSTPTKLPLRAYADPVKTLNLRIPLPTLAPAIAPAPIEAPVVVVAAPAPSNEKPQIPIIEVPPSAAIVESIVASNEIEGELPLPGAPIAWLDNGRPAWAQQPFECLLFKVGGLALAAPLAELGSIYPHDTALLTAIFGQAPWFMGLLPVKGYNVRVIDAAQVVMPERYAASMREHYRYVITLHGSDWGLAVDSVADSIVLQPEQVRWRGQRSKRPWLAGTLVTQMCALLDVAQLIWMFQNQDGKRAVL
jgi:purine-binding chemotaxis protein CheW